MKARRRPRQPDGGRARWHAPGVALLLLGIWALTPAVATAGRDAVGRAASERHPAGDGAALNQIELSFQMRPLRLAITEPKGGEPLPPGPLVVRGIIVGAGPEVSVTVNREPALVQGNAFVALVEAAPLTTEITAVAATLAGATATATLPIRIAAMAAPSGPPRPVRLSSGIAPLAISFTAPGAAQFELDATGDGFPELAGRGPGPLPFVFARPGIHVATATLRDHRGLPARGRAILLALDGPALDAVLQTRWAAMRDALRAGDVARAAGYT